MSCFRLDDRRYKFVWRAFCEMLGLFLKLQMQRVQLLWEHHGLKYDGKTLRSCYKLALFFRKKNAFIDILSNSEISVVLKLIYHQPIHYLIFNDNLPRYVSIIPPRIRLTETGGWSFCVNTTVVTNHFKFVKITFKNYLGQALFCSSNRSMSQICFKLLLGTKLAYKFVVSISLFVIELKASLLSAVI